MDRGFYALCLIRPKGIYVTKTHIEQYFNVCICDLHALFHFRLIQFPVLILFFFSAKQLFVHGKNAHQNDKTFDSHLFFVCCRSNFFFFFWICKLLLLLFFHLLRFCWFFCSYAMLNVPDDDYKLFYLWSLMWYVSYASVQSVLNKMARIIAWLLIKYWL